MIYLSLSLPHIFNIFTIKSIKIISYEQMDKKLFLKEKDYDMIKFKSEVKFNQTLHDPLINPNNKIKTNKIKNPSNKVNIFDGEPLGSK